MDYAQYLRLKQEAANVYVARMKTVDSSFLTMQKQQKAAYAGSSIEHTTAYYKGSPVVNPIEDNVNSCAQNKSYINGYTATNNLSQQEDRASRIAGGFVCNSVDYSRASRGITLKNCQEVSTILTSFNNNTPAPSLVCTADKIASPGGMAWGKAGSGFMYDTLTQDYARKNC